MYEIIDYLVRFTHQKKCFEESVSLKCTSLVPQKHICERTSSSCYDNKTTTA